MIPGRPGIPRTVDGYDGEKRERTGEGRPQGSRLQAWLSDESPVHAIPPDCAAFCVRVLIGQPGGDKERAVGTYRVCEPPPQVAEQEDQTDQAFHVQSTGQACELHVCSSKSGPVQSAPPLAATTSCVRVRRAIPPLHATEQSPHGDQALHTQSTGQGEVLQDWD